MYHYRLCNHLNINYDTNYTPYEKPVLSEKNNLFLKSFNLLNGIAYMLNVASFEYLKIQNLICNNSITHRIKTDTYNSVHMKSKKISNDQELIQSDPTSCPQNQKGNN